MTLSAAGLRRLEALEVLATSSMPVLTVSLPFATKSRANDNTSNHWGPRAKASKAHRTGAYIVLSSKRSALIKLLDRGGLVVRVVRIAPKALDGHDNLGMALKAITDGIADVLQVNDRDPRVEFVPDAESGAHGVRVEFYERGDTA